jgi:hypothetical protein
VVLLRISRAGNSALFIDYDVLLNSQTCNNESAQQYDAYKQKLIGLAQHHSKDKYALRCACSRA